MGINEKKQGEMVESQSITLPNGIVITSFGKLVTCSMPWYVTSNAAEGNDSRLPLLHIALASLGYDGSLAMALYEGSPAMVREKMQMLGEETLAHLYPTSSDRFDNQ